MRKLGSVCLLALGLVLWSRSPLQAQGAAVAEQIAGKAIIESVDQSTRTIVLRREDDSLVSIKAGPEVRNFAQVKAGDRVAVRVRLGVLAVMAPDNGAAGTVTQSGVAAQAPAGAKPGALTGETLMVRVTFNSYDSKSKTVSLTLPSGQERSMVLKAKQMQDFAAGLKTGDKVDVTFVQSIAVAVVPAQ
jgi:Cu/Ag efflux protein CusF